MPKYTREEILSEIRRVSEQNGGTPVGRNRFKAVTGITEGAWSGIFWTTWGQAVSEAGYAPNSLQRKDYDNSQLLLLLVGLVRRYGRYPTIAEIKIERTHTPTFPSHNTFTRLGTKAEIVPQLLGLADSEPEFADLSELLPVEPTRVAVSLNPEVTGTGHVYLLKMGRYHKVGRSNDVGRRFYELRIQMPEKATLVHSLSTDDPEGIERYWHERFSSKRANGEWFLLSADDVAAFKSRGSSM